MAEQEIALPMPEASEEKSLELILPIRTETPIPNRQILLGKYTSQQNKVWLATGWSHFRNWYIDWKWVGRPFRSRMLFRFSSGDVWVRAESFEEDLLPTYKFAKEK